MHSGIVVTARALLDSGSQLNFITNLLADKLGVRSTPSSVAIQGIGCSLLNSSGSALITIKSKHNGYTTKFEAQILSKISNNQPAFNFDLSQFSIPSNLQLADPKFHSCQRVDMLIGAESFYERQCVGQLKLGPGLPYLQKTQLGWVVSGSVDIFNKDQGFCHLVELNSSGYLNRLLERFWEVEEKEDDTDTNSCEQHFIYPKCTGKFYYIQTTRNTNIFSGGLIPKIQCKPKENGYQDAAVNQAISQDMYVDDLLTGANSTNEAIQLRQNVSSILQDAGMVLRKWCSNKEEVLHNIDSTDREKLLFFEETEYIKTLGLYWHSVKDCFRIKVSPSTHSTKVTKRMIVSEIAKIYDPIGLVSPVVVIGKMIMQDIWKLKYDWDESLPIQLHTTWVHYRDELEHLQRLYIPRHLFDGNSLPSQIQIHGFADASEKGYGAALYVRSKTTSGFCIRLLCSKSRVAPLKNKPTLPRLELCAATLLAKLISKYKSIINYNISQIYCWSDSTITLHWIHSDSSRWTQFVANRVQKIQSATNPSLWYHVDSKNNPADLISRGVRPQSLIDL